MLVTPPVTTLLESVDPSQGRKSVPWMDIQQPFQYPHPSLRQALVGRKAGQRFGIVAEHALHTSFGRAPRLRAAVHKSDHDMMARSVPERSRSARVRR